MPSVRSSRSCDVLFLSDHLRAEDRAECMASSGRGPFDVLMEGLSISDECHTALNDAGVPFAMFGVAPIEGNPRAGAVWLLATDELKKHAVYLLRNTDKYIAQFHLRYPILANVADERNTAHLRWVEWAGFSGFKRLEGYGHEQRPFIYFQSVI